MPDYELLKPHRLNKTLQPAGFVATDIPEQLGKWWIEQGIAERIVVDQEAPAPVVEVALPATPAARLMPAPKNVTPWGCCSKQKW